jgi:TolB-like protein
MTRLVMIAALLLTTTSATSAMAAAGNAIAVMPFKNLSGQADLDWLSLGISETLVADLQKEGSRRVVERAQVDRAIAEIALQSQQQDETGTAAHAGRLVGATTVVVGGFQASGRGETMRLRLTARFVNVESGVVIETAKVDGAVSDVFDLQDQIVAKLVGKPKRAPRKKAKAPEKRVEAFRVYSLSLTTSSQADQVKYLREAVALDPEFVYARDDLFALEKRLRDYRRDAAKQQDAATTALLATVADTSRPEAERANAALQALPAYAAAMRWRSLLDVAQRIYSQKEPLRGPAGDVRELASYYVFLAHMMLKDGDLALQAGERHLKEFPAGVYAGSVDMQLQNMISDRQRRDDARARIPKELAEVDADEREILEKKKPPPNLADRVRLFAFRRCTAVYQGRDYEDAIRRCLAFADEYAADEPSHLARSARYFAAMSHAELGQFDDARRIMLNLSDEDAAWARSMGVPSMLQMWPKD